MAIVTDLLIIYTDGEVRTIKGVEKYEVGEDGFRKNGYTSFLPKESIRYFGRKFDYEN